MSAAPSPDAAPAEPVAILREIMWWLGERQLQMPTPLLLRLRAVTEAAADDAAAPAADAANAAYVALAAQAARVAELEEATKQQADLIAMYAVDPPLSKALARIAELERVIDAADAWRKSSIEEMMSRQERKAMDAFDAARQALRQDAQPKEK